MSVCIVDVGGEVDGLGGGMGSDLGCVGRGGISWGSEGEGGRVLGGVGVVVCVVKAREVGGLIA